MERKQKCFIPYWKKIKKMKMLICQVCDQSTIYVKEMSEDWIQIDQKEINKFSKIKRN